MDQTALTRRTAAAYFALTGARDWAGLGELLTPDVVYEIPQTRERIRGRERFLQFNAEYPGDWTLAVRRLIADGQGAAGLVGFTVGDEHQDASIWLELTADGLIERIVDYWPDTYEPPPGREHLVERW